MNLKILKTINECMKGVIGLDELGEDDVYLFLNTSPGTNFHMQGVSFPIEILFMDKEFTILDSTQMSPETGKACAPSGTVYAAEVHPEYLAKNKLKNGDFFQALYTKYSVKTP